MSSTNPQISIICPVYNAEKTIHKCLDCIVNQTFKDWELILVNDGSTDSSGAVCDGYANIDNRIKVIHKPNGGVATARQTGLDNALGEYIIHVDPDDWVECTMLEEMYRHIFSTNADMLICDFFVEINGKTLYTKQKPSSLESCVVLNELFRNIHGSCCNKMVKRSCIEKCKARFPVGINYCEDVCFNIQLLKYDIKIAYFSMAFYHYIQYPTSLTNHFTHKTLKEGKKYVEFLSNQLPCDSFPVLRAKELIKTNAFKYSLITRQELSFLYPEIIKVTNEKFFPTIMYNSAFTGHYIIASILLYIYRSIQSVKSEKQCS